MKKTFFSALLLCVGMSARAQEPDSTDVFFRHLELGEVVVTGVAGDTRIKETPSPISVVPAAELQARAATNIVDAIAREPGLSAITTGGGIAKPVIRGLGYNRVIVVTDGIRQEGQQWGDEHGLETDGFSVHTVEILKGPASLLWGSDALAGVIILRPEPLPMPGTVRGSVQAQGQTNSGLLAYSLSVGGNHSGWIWKARFSDRYARSYYNKADGLVPNSGFRERSAQLTLGRNASWGYSRINATYFQLTPGMVDDPERDPGTGRLTGGDTSYKLHLPFQQVRHFKVVSDNTIHVGPGHIKAILGWQHNRRQEYEESDTEPGLDFLMNTVNYDLKYLLEAGWGWKIAAGAGGMLQQSRNLGEEYLIPAYRLADVGIYATATKTLGAWTLSGGLRGDFRFLHAEALDGRFKAFDRHFNGISASIGAVRPLGSHFTLRINAARGFRAPNLAELGSNGEHEGTFRYELGNADLKPENSLQGDLGLDFTSKYVSFTSALFVNRVGHYIYAAQNGQVVDEMPVYAYRSGTAWLKGGEVSVDVHPFHSLHIGGAFSCVYAQEEGGTDLPLIPAPRLFSEVKYEITHEGKLFSNAYVVVNVDWNMRQNHFLPETETATPAYALLGAGAGTDLFIRGRKWASITLIGTNLTDAAYIPHLSRFKRIGVHNPGRNIVLKISIPIG